jgi:DNA-binding XRE family transcriptional regulator
VYPFTNNSNLFKTAYKIEIPLQILLPDELIQKPVTLGDHLRRRRLELGLYQKDVAAKIGVTTSTIWNWEHNWTIDPRYIPLVIEVLGYNPVYGGPLSQYPDLPNNKRLNLVSTRHDRSFKPKQ